MFNETDPTRSNKSVNSARPVMDAEPDAQRIKLRVDNETGNADLSGPANSSQACSSPLADTKQTLAASASTDVRLNDATARTPRATERSPTEAEPRAAASPLGQNKFEGNYPGDKSASTTSAATAPPSIAQHNAAGSVTGNAAGNLAWNVDSNAVGNVTTRLGDPAASENEWIPALIELSKQDKLLSKPKPRQSLASAIISMLLVTGCLGFGSWYVSMHDPAVVLGLKKAPDYQSYIKAVQTKIKKQWTPPPNYGRVKAHFKIAKDGDISDLGLSNMTYYSPTDMAALKAIEDAAPFPPLPEGFGNSVDIDFTFEYNAHSENKK